LVTSSPGKDERGHHSCVGASTRLFAGAECEPLQSTAHACRQALLERFACPAVSLSEPFEDGEALRHVGAKAVRNVGLVTARLLLSSAIERATRSIVQKNATLH
jgi:hypothetical protein